MKWRSSSIEGVGADDKQMKTEIATLEAVMGSLIRTIMTISKSTDVVAGEGTSISNLHGVIAAVSADGIS